MSEWVSQWQGHLLSCSWQLKTVDKNDIKTWKWTIDILSSFIWQLPILYNCTWDLAEEREVWIFFLEPCCHHRITLICSCDKVPPVKCMSMWSKKWMVLMETCSCLQKLCPEFWKQWSQYVCNMCDKFCSQFALFTEKFTQSTKILRNRRLHRLRQIWTLPSTKTKFAQNHIRYTENDIH